jgi:hypothetical protein
MPSQQYIGMGALVVTLNLGCEVVARVLKITRKAMLVNLFRKFFGLDLPVRDVPLQFKLPNTSSQLAVGHGSDREFFNRLDAVDDAPAEYFAILRNSVKHMNRCAMKSRHRLVLTREILRLFYPVALESLIKITDEKRGGGGIFLSNRISSMHLRTCLKFRKFWRCRIKSSFQKFIRVVIFSTQGRVLCVKSALPAFLS